MGDWGSVARKPDLPTPRRRQRRVERVGGAWISPAEMLRKMQSFFSAQNRKRIFSGISRVIFHHLRQGFQEAFPPEFSLEFLLRKPRLFSGIFAAIGGFSRHLRALSKPLILLMGHLSAPPVFSRYVYK